MPSLDEQALMIYNKRMLHRGLPTRQVQQTDMYCYLRLQSNLYGAGYTYGFR